MTLTGNQDASRNAALGDLRSFAARIVWASFIQRGIGLDYCFA